MNKIISVNIGGLVFQIDESAYDKLKSYFEALRAQFEGTEGEEEILRDIELRIAEIFTDKMKSGSQAIFTADIEEIIEIMGRPEDYRSEDEDESYAREMPESEEFEPVSTTGTDGTGSESKTGRKTGKSSSYKGERRRFFRDPDNKVLGGVCSGFASYIDVDPLIVRLAFLLFVLAFGTGGLLYLILWVLIPEASNRTEKMHMRGEKVNVENIQKTIKKEAEELKKRFTEFTGNAESTAKKATRDMEGPTRNFFEQLFDVFGTFFKGGFKVILAILAIAALVILISIFFSMAGAASVAGAAVPEFSEYIFSNGSQQVFSSLALILLFGIPFIVLLYKSIKYLFNIETGTRHLDRLFLFLWIVGFVLVFYMGTRVAMEFQRSAHITDEVKTERVEARTVYLDLLNDHQTDDYWDGPFVGINTNELKIMDDTILLSNIHLSIEQSSTNEFALFTVKESRGKNRNNALDNARSIVYRFDQQDSLIYLDSFFSLEGAPWRHQELKLIFTIPLGRSVILDERLSDDMYIDVETAEYIPRRELYNTPLVMMEDGLVPISNAAKKEEETPLVN